MFEILDHTADTGLRVAGEDLETLLREAADGFSALAVAKPEAVSGRKRTTYVDTADDLVDLLHDWMEWHVYQLSAHRMLWRVDRLTVRNSGGEWTLEAVLDGERLEPERHRPRQEIKAATYHDLAVERDGQGYVAQIIFDI